MWSKLKHSKPAVLAGSVASRVEADARRQPSIVLIALIAGVAASFVFSISVAAIWVLFVLFLVYDWDTRAAVALGTFSFALCLVFAITDKRAWFEVAAAYTYFFFGIAVMIWSIKYARTRLAQ